MKLYNITADYTDALTFFADLDNTLSLDTALDTLDAIEGDFEQKAVNVAAYAKQLDAEAEAIKTLTQKGFVVIGAWTIWGHYHP